MGDVLLFVFSVFDTGVLLLLTVYVVIALSDLECDYLNAQQCCSKLNKWVIPETIGHGIITVLLLITLHWFLFLANIPMTSWQIYKIVTIPSGNFGVYDPTEIHNRGNLRKHMRDSMIRLAFYLIFFFVYLYCLTLWKPKLCTDEKLNDDIEFICHNEYINFDRMYSFPSMIIALLTKSPGNTTEL